MSPRLARLLVRFYPQWWRARYGREFVALLETGPGGFRVVANVVCSGIWERALAYKRMDANPSPSFGEMLSWPSAVFPIAMSSIALTMVIAEVATNGITRGGDEGAVAHIWQLLMAGQMPILAFFAIRWLPKFPRQTLKILGLQIGACLASMAPVYFLNL